MRSHGCAIQAGLSLVALLLSLSGCVLGVEARQREAQTADGTDGPFIWPVEGVVTSEFGRPRGGRRHRGLDISAKAGTPIRAAAAGRITFSGRSRGYGLMLVIQHGGGYATAYAHQRKNLVRKGARVQRGQVIGEVGASGNATAPHLHFEIRVRGEARNPRIWLPNR